MFDSNLLSVLKTEIVTCSTLPWFLKEKSVSFLILIFFFPLTEVKPGGQCLELFARNLQPGWMSWGNEVLKFQHMDYFIALESGC